MTKEPKLEAAVRIVPEWQDYDQEIKQLQTLFQEEKELGTLHEEWEERRKDAVIGMLSELNKIKACTTTSQLLCLFTEHLMSIYYMPGTTLSNEDSKDSED